MQERTCANEGVCHHREKNNLSFPNEKKGGVIARKARFFFGREEGKARPVPYIILTFKHWKKKKRGQ